MGKEGIITQLNKALLERILNAEMDFHLNNTNEGRAAGNTRNGYSKKTLKSNFRQLELSTPRDRHSTFEPQIIPKRSTKSAILEDAILSLYAKGMTVRDIQETLQDLYHVEVSPSLISKVTDVVNEDVEQWHDRPLEKWTMPSRKLCKILFLSYFGETICIFVSILDGTRRHNARRRIYSDIDNPDTSAFSRISSCCVTRIGMSLLKNAPSKLFLPPSS